MNAEEVVRRPAHSEAWLDAFHAQFPDACKQARRFLAHMLSRLDHCSSGTAKARAEDLVQEAIADVLAGEVPWDPADPLGDFLIGVCRMRERRERRRRYRYHHASIDEADPDNARSALAQAEAALRAAAIDEAEAQRLLRMDAAMEQLHALAANDPQAQRYLAAAEIAERIMEIRPLSGLSEVDYHNTRRRVARYVHALMREGGAS